MIGTLVARLSAKAAYNSLNRRDISAFLSGWAEDATFIFPGEVPISGTHQGKQNIEKIFQTFLAQFPRFNFSLKNILVKNVFDLIGSNVIAVEWDITGENKDGLQFSNSGVSIIELRGMKARQVQDYFFDYTTLQKAWGK
ncbi:MAG: nuclear transport factor 2 family protein [Acidiferrobacterales bacterium]